ncbi:MAG: DUF1684 domain-containing protein [Acidiferrobacterales bacterium]
MTTRNDPITLAAWRRAVAGMYADARVAAVHDQREAAERFRRHRDALFASHPNSPIDPEKRTRFEGLRYYPFDPAYRVPGKIDRDVDRMTTEIELAPDGRLRYTRVGRVRFGLNRVTLALNLYWIEGYGGGLFLPFKDKTNGRTTHGGGRYLYDTIKGADLGIDHNQLILDFNYAYNPSCAYNAKWACPLAPPENELQITVNAGELAFDP